MTTAIRFEHPFDGCGIYNSGLRPCDTWYDKMRDRHVDSLPNPRGDRKLKGIEDDEFCAFLSIEQLKSIITKNEYSKLIHGGFVVYEIVVSACRVGEHQILYTKDSVVSMKNITENIY